jgi:hypothetical protein
LDQLDDCRHTMRLDQNTFCLNLGSQLGGPAVNSPACDVALELTAVIVISRDGMHLWMLRRLGVVGTSRKFGN